MTTTDLDAWLAEVGKSQFGWPESLRFTYDKTRELLADGIPGDLVECGVANGCHPAVMARACMDAGETRTVRLFDSYAGIPMGGSKDADWNEHYGDGSGDLVSSGVTVCSLADVQRNLERWLPGCEIPMVMHPGWFQDTAKAFAKVAIGVGASIALLRIDGDLYESTKVCLEHLYPLVSPGGFVVIDDWNLDGCRAALRDYFTIAGQHVTDISLHYMLDMRDITESGDVWFTKPVLWP